MTTIIDPDRPAADAGALREIALDQLRSTPNRAMRNIEELAASIREVGLLQPITVTPAPGAPDFYDVVDGRRRYEACRQAGLLFVPCLVRTLDDVGARIAALVANLERDDLKPLEEAAQYHELVNEHGLTQTELAVRVTRSEAHVSKRLSLLLLPDEARTALADGRIKLTTALGLTGLVKHPDRLERVLDDLPEAELYGDDDVARNRLARAQDDLDRQLAAELRAADAERKAAAVAADLAEHGETVLEYPPFGNYDRIPGGDWRVCRQGEDPEAYTVDPRGHAVKLTTKALPDDKRLSKVGGTGKVAKAETARLAKVAKERDAAAERRTSVMRSILSGRKVARDKLAEFVAHQTLAYHLGLDADVGSARDACDLLDVQVEPGSRFGDTLGEEALTRYAAHGGLEATRAAAALWLVAFNPTARELEHGMIDWADAGVRNHYGFLAAHGYEYTAEEVEAFEAAAATPTTEDE